MRLRALLLLLAVAPLSGCLFRSHKVETPAFTGILLSTTRQDLVDRLNYLAHSIRTMNATVDIATSVGGAKKGKVTEYQEIRGYILVRQPGMLRMIGLMPVIRNRAFDMVSNGSTFELWVPPKDKFYVGRNDQVAPGATGLAALRPQVIYDALLLDAVEGPADIAVLESGVQTVVNPKTHKETEQPDYRLDIIHRESSGWYLARKVYFSRINLQPYRQEVFDKGGSVSSDTRYDQWKQHGAVWYPDVIQINRPTEEYDITIGMVKLVLNEPLADQQFALAQPPGAQVVRLNGGNTSASDGSEK